MIINGFGGEPHASLNDSSAWHTLTSFTVNLSYTTTAAWKRVILPTGSGFAMPDISPYRYIRVYSSNHSFKSSVAISSLTSDSRIVRIGCFFNDAADAGSAADPSTFTDTKAWLVKYITISSGGSTIPANTNLFSISSLTGLTTAYNQFRYAQPSLEQYYTDKVGSAATNIGYSNERYITTYLYNGDAETGTIVYPMVIAYSKESSGLLSATFTWTGTYYLQGFYY